MSMNDLLGVGEYVSMCNIHVFREITLDLDFIALTF